MVPRRKPAPVAALFAIPVPAIEGKDGGIGYTGVWHGAGASFGIVATVQSEAQPQPLIRGGRGLPFRGMDIRPR